MGLPYFKKHIHLFILVITTTILDLYILRNSITIGIVQSSDWPIPLTDLTSVFYSLFPAWSYQNMSSNGINIFLLSYDFISSVTHNPVVIQKVFYYVPWTLTPFSAYILLKLIGLKRGNIFFSLLYQFGPWLTGQFMDGEPVNVILYLFIPLVLFVIIKFNSSLPKLYIYLTIAMMIPSFFTLEAPFFYIVLIIPFLFYDLWSNGIEYTLKRTLIITMSFFTVILFNIYSLLPYIDAYSGSASSLSSTVNGFIKFPPAVVEKYWLILIVTYLIISTFLLMIKDKTKMKIYFLFFTVMSVFFILIYPGFISDYLGIYIISKIPILAPFINPNEFLLYLWIELFIIVVYSAVVLNLNGFHNDVSKLRNVYKRVKKPAVLVIVFGIVLLLVSSATIEIQSFGSHDTDIYMFSQGTHFDKTQIKPQYEYLLKYLESHGASFNLSFHTIILPENPANTVPFYIGSEMIPGYEGLFNRSISTSIINGINTGNSSFLMLLSVLGIKYIAVMNIPASKWSGSNGAPQLSLWGDKSIFIGNYTYYLRELNNISGLNQVYSNNGIWIFENKYYKSPILESSYTYIKDIVSGNFNKMVEVKNISTNLLNNPKWYYSGGNYTLNSDLNFTLHKSTSDLLICTYISLYSNATYELSFIFNTTGTDNLYYGNGQNAVMLFYNVTKSYSHVIGGTIITIAPESIANNTYRSYFNTPSYNSSIPAKFIIQLESPIRHNAINVSISNISLKKVKITNNFNRFFLPVSYKLTGLTTLRLFNIDKNQTIILDQCFGPGWYIKGTTNEVTRNSESGLMQLNLSDSGTVVIYYKYQNTYNYLLLLSFSSIIAFLGTSMFYELKRIKIKRVSR